MSRPFYAGRENFVLTPGPFGWLPPYDDGYITLTSAQALWSGHIPNYPDTPVLYGITSPVHTALVAILLPFAEPMTALWLTQIIGALLYAAGLWHLGRAWSLDVRERWAVVAIGLMAGVTPFHLMNGLETGLALATVTWMIAGTHRLTGWAPILYGLAPFVRPELALLSLACGAWWVWHTTPQQWMRGGALAALTVLPCMAFLWTFGDSWLPTTGSTKAAFLADRCQTALIKSIWLVWGLLRWIIAMGILTVGIVGFRRPGLPRVLGLLLAVVCGMYIVLIPSHFSHYHEQRYLAGWMPLVFFGGLALIERWPRRAVTIAAVFIATVAVAPFNWTRGEFHDWRRYYVPELQAFSAFLDENIPKGSRLMILDAGYPAYTTDYPLIDMVGLKDPHSSAIHKAITLPSCAARRGDALARIASDGRAQYFIPWSTWNEWLKLADSLRAAGWTLEPLRPRPAHAADPDRNWWYEVYRLTPPAREMAEVPESRTQPARHYAGSDRF